jgi:ribonuclease-3
MSQSIDLDTLQQRLNVAFRQPDLLRQALTHRSFINEQPSKELQDNERMEFLGDAVLDFVSGDLLYQLYPNKSEGELTRLRSAIVRTEALAELAVQLELGDYLLMGKGESTNGGRTRPSILCSTFEAVVGAIYLDQGMNAVQTFVTPQFRQFVTQVEEEAIDKDARSRLQEWSQAELGITPQYETQASLGPDHNKEFIVQVQIGEQFTATGKGRSKQSASQNAAQTALDMIRAGQLPGKLL